MNTLKETKKPIVIGCIGAAAVLLTAVFLLLFLPERGADPRSLLSKADALTEQNLCLTALLAENPQDEESWRQLLVNYQLLGADPITQKATRQAAAAALGHGITVADTPATQPEEAGSVIGTGGIVHGGLKLTDYKDANALVTDGETVYLARPDGIYADYHDLLVQLTPARAARMIAAENGLYYLNTAAGRVQYIARDGHKTETLSTIPAADFAWLNGALWIAGTDGVLYKDGGSIETPRPVTALCTAQGRLFAAGGEGLMCITESGGELVLSSPVSGIAGSEDGCVYFIQQNGYPARYDPTTKEAVILTEKTAVAIGCSEGRVYYLNTAKKIKRCG